MDTSMIWKAIKDGLRGAMMSLLPLFMSGLTGAASWITVIGGIISAVLGIVAGAIQGKYQGTSVWMRIANDTLYGFLVVSQGILQNGIGDGQKAAYILIGLLIAFLGVFANVLHDDYSTATGILKIVKDCFITGINVLVPALQAGMTSGATLGVILLGASHSLFSALGNTLEADIFGTVNAKPDPSVKP